MSNETQQPNAFLLNREKNTITVAGKEFPITHSEWTIWQESGFRWRTYRYSDVNPEISDGADIEIKDGGHTPVQAFVPKRNGEIEFYWEQPLEGDLTLLYLDKEGRAKTETFNSKTLSRKMMAIQPGMVMCWFGGKTDEGVSHVQESEYPGFDDEDLQTAPYRVSKFNGINIPIEFWDKFDQLETKRKLGAPREFDDEGNYTKEYILWWAKITKTDLKKPGLMELIDDHIIQLDLPSCRTSIIHFVGSYLVNAKGNGDGLNERKVNFLLGARQSRETALISGGISLEEFDKWIALAEKEKWTPDFITKLYAQWCEISKPKDQR